MLSRSTSTIRASTSRGDLTPSSNLPSNPNLFLKVPLSLMAGGSVTWNALAGNDRLAVDYSAGPFFAGTAHLPLNLNFGGQAGDFLLLTSEDDDDRNSDTPIETAFTAQATSWAPTPARAR